MNFKKITIYLVAVSVTLSSCYSDLDPEDLGARNPNAANVYKTVDDYKSGLAKVYSSFAVSGQQGPAGQGDISGIDEGFGQYMRAYWNAQELTTDEAVIAWNDQTIKDYHWHSWTPTDVFIASLYYRIMYTVAVANEYIRAADASDIAEVKQFGAEARFLRALAYTHGLDLFGNMPFVTEADKPGAFSPPQTTRIELFDYVEEQLLSIEELLGEPRFEYGRADKAAAWMLLAKLYLNAEVYTGTNRYSDAVAQLNKVLSSSYELADEHRFNFLADNHTSPEMIFPITFDGSNTQTYGGTTYILNAQLGGSMPKESMFGSKSGWSGIRVTSALVDLFDDASGNTDARAMFWSDGQSKEINDIGVFTDGFASTKFRNLTKTGALAPHVAYSGSGDTFVDIDFPIFRLADAYLMYAEAVLRGGTGGEFNSLDLVNALRERAYGDDSGNILQGDLTLDFILDERGRELFWEGHRRTDLIRFGKFTGGEYLWPWKGHVKEGAATPAFRNLFPIPSSDIAANTNLTQNDGY
jgi:starch-binding outer membrane protein, SusD/RagB family